MSDPPVIEGKTQEEGNHLNRFGRWMMALNTIIGTNMVDMATRAGVSKGAISLATHGASGASKETVLALAEHYRKLAEDKKIALPVAWELFFSISWFDSTEIIGGADQALKSLEDWAAVVKERDLLKREVERERMIKEKLAQEVQTLRRENRMLRRELRGREKTLNSEMPME